MKMTDHCSTALNRKRKTNELERTIFLKCFDASLKAEKKKLGDTRIVHAISQEEKSWLFTGSQFCDPRCTVNMIKGAFCPNDCIYCYIKPMMKRFKKDYEKIEVTCTEDLEDLDFPFPVNEASVKRKIKTPKSDDDKKVYMSPSSHDIFPAMIGAFINLILNVLKEGHDLVIVTKPRISCVKILIDELTSDSGDLYGYRDNVILRFSIGSLDEDILSLFEPHAPSARERGKCLKYAKKRGMRTSISMEPFLSDPIEMVSKLEKYVTDDIWIGDINHFNMDEHPYSEVSYLYTREYSTKIVRKLRNNNKVFFKDSIFKKYMRISKPRKKLERRDD